MSDKVSELIERECSYPAATQKDVWRALDSAAARWQASSRSTKMSREKKSELLYYVARAGRILHYFHHGYVGGASTPDDDRLADLIAKLPRG